MMYGKHKAKSADHEAGLKTENYPPPPPALSASLSAHLKFAPEWGIFLLGKFGFGM